MPIILIGNSLDMHRAEKAGLRELPGSTHLGRGVWAFRVTALCEGALMDGYIETKPPRASDGSDPWGLGPARTGTTIDG